MMVERLFLMVPRGCLQFVIVVFPDHTHLLFLAYGPGLRLKLRKREYSEKDIEKQLHKVDTLKREDLLSVKSQVKKEDRVPLVLTFSRHLPDKHKIVRKHLSVT